MATVGRELGDFVKEALARRTPRAEIERVLLEAGWPPEPVRAALAAYADLEFPIPVPRPRPSLSAREAFLYLLLFSALGMSAYRLGALLFGIIDSVIPDPVAADWVVASAADRIRWSIATLLVAFPVYLLVARRIARETKKEPGKRASRVRRWLTYLTLFIAAVTVIGDLVVLIYGFLSGDLTVRVSLKILTVGVIAGTIFLYYLHSAARDEREA
ncbi:DUF5671 domain-containing protein [Rhodospirillaceae bacterium SYSU D60014]|uniref:DUF5671 domain-containing protein n=1 Tax=Virgifigura deserti TaxID=2268457 RepID=UPI000E660D73